MFISFVWAESLSYAKSDKVFAVAYNQIAYGTESTQSIDKSLDLAILPEFVIVTIVQLFMKNVKSISEMMFTENPRYVEFWDCIRD